MFDVFDLKSAPTALFLQLQFIRPVVPFPIILTVLSHASASCWYSVVQRAPRPRLVVLSLSLPVSVCMYASWCACLWRGVLGSLVLKLHLCMHVGTSAHGCSMACMMPCIMNTGVQSRYRGWFGCSSCTSCAYTFGMSYDDASRVLALLSFGFFLSFGRVAMAGFDDSEESC